MSTLRDNEYSIASLAETPQTITEAQVTEWMARQLTLEADAALPVHYLTVSVHRRFTDSIFFSCGMHIPGGLFFGKSLDEARQEMRKSLSRPQEMEAEKRKKAADLLREASELEGVAGC